jgi:hypothetical protein
LKEPQNVLCNKKNSVKKLKKRKKKLKKQKEKKEKDFLKKIITKDTVIINKEKTNINLMIKIK